MKHPNKLLITGLALFSLTACNSSDEALEVTPRASTTQAPAGDILLRNMATDLGTDATSPDAVDVPAAEGVNNLFDGSNDTKFLSFSPSVTIEFTAVSPYVLRQYQLTSANDQPNRDPGSWTLEGSTDGQNWQQLDSQNGQTFDSRSATNTYELTTNETAYQHYRFSATHIGTDDYGADIIQLSELAFMVQADKPLVAFKSHLTRAEVGEKVFFLDQSLANPTSWSWTFEDGTPATSTEQHPTVIFNSIGPKTVTLEASNDKGSSTLTVNHSIWIWDSQNPWAGFPQPDVTLVKTDPQHPGQLALDRVMPDLVDTIHEISLGVSQILYYDVTEIPIFNTVTFETGHYDYPAAKGGTQTDMYLTMDLGHLEQKAMESDEALKAEVIGMLWHELTHGYSAVPQTGQYAAGDEFHTFLEALADFVRIEAGYNEHKRPGVKWVNTWNDDAYNQTSFFLEWVHKTYTNTQFIKEFNRAANQLEYWSFDDAFKQVLGNDNGIQKIWDKYQREYLQGVLGLTPPYPTPVTGYHNFATDHVVSISTDATDISIWGEGVDKLIDNNVTIKFNGIIEAPWWVEQYAPDLLPINEVTAVSVDVELNDAIAMEKYSLTPGNDNPQRDPSYWQVFASNDGFNWQLIGENEYPANPERLITYHFDIDALNDYYQPYSYYRFTFYNEQQGTGVGGDDGRLVQIGELALLTQE